MTMKITAATFAACSVGRDSMPKDGKPVFAMIGRSNVGKSSMINTLVGRRELAKTSSTPGKTLTLNYYLINESFYLVDLPGYGFAKASKVTRDRVHQMVTDFFEIAESLCGIIHVLDVRHLPSNLDLEMSRWIEEQRFRYLPILTKIDKLSQNDLTKMVRAITKKIGVTAALLFSSKTSQGKEEIIDTLDYALANPDAGPLLVKGTGMKPLKKRVLPEQSRGRQDHRQGGGPRHPQRQTPSQPSNADTGAPQATNPAEKPDSPPASANSAGQPAPAGQPQPQGGRQGSQPREGRQQGPRRERRPDHQRQGQGGQRPQGPRPPQPTGQPSDQAGTPPAPGQAGSPNQPGQPGQQPQQGPRNRHRPHHRRRDGQGGGGNPGKPPSNPAPKPE